MIETIRTQTGVIIEVEQSFIDYQDAIESLIDHLDQHLGAVFTSGFEFPGRYTCWDIGFYNPPLKMVCCGEWVECVALNQRGQVLIALLLPSLKTMAEAILIEEKPNFIKLRIKKSSALFTEEARSQQPSVFSVLREILKIFKSDEEPYLGLYGAFGYDLIFQFEAIPQKLNRNLDQRDMVIYFPDEIFIVDHRKEQAFVRRYDFAHQQHSTKGLSRSGEKVIFTPHAELMVKKDIDSQSYIDKVHLAKQSFACGDLFELVLSQTFERAYQDKPSVLFRRMREKNPSPYGFLIHLGQNEYLIGASPEMYVRVQGQRVETCPISGTIRRGENAIEDAAHIQALLSSAKESSELTMCTDVDRNDKSRVCEPGSVCVIGRRQIEMYSRLIHTVDHVEGQLRPEFDAIDAFLTHMWVVTVTGAPKLWAMEFIEQYEESPREWYAGAVGWFGVNGHLNTGLILRTFHLKQGVAKLRTGATLLYDSIPQDEEQETRLKAAAFLELLDAPNNVAEKKQDFLGKPGLGLSILLIDHQDSFVHTLANYLRQTAAKVVTIRSEHAITYLEQNPHFDLVVLSPGPGKPQDFNLNQTIDCALRFKIPIFGVCLGLQGLVEYFGGRLAILDYPMHGKPSSIQVKDKTDLFMDFDDTFIAGRYHSLYAQADTLPSCLRVTAITEDEVIMAITHEHLPIYAVQFHPETILSLQNQAGLKIIFNLMKIISSKD